MLAHRCEDAAGIGLQKAKHEVVGMLRADVKLPERGLGKILQIDSHDDIRIAMDRGGKDMPVIGVGQVERVNELLIAGHFGIEDMGFHEGAGARDLLRKFRPGSQQGLRPFFLNSRGPFGPEQMCARKTHQEITKRCRIERARVKNDDR